MPPQVITDSEGKGYLVTETVVRFLEKYNIPEDDFITVIAGMLWHDIHSDAVDVLATTELKGSIYSRWLIHELAREVKAA